MSKSSRAGAAPFASDAGATVLQHTPGPWAVGFSDGSGRGDSEDDGAWIVVPDHSTTKTEDVIVIVRGDYEGHGVTGRTPAERRANARLIAVAPDLLAEAREALNALQNVRDYLLKHSHRLPPMSSTGCEVRIEKLRAAITKATEA